MIRKLLLMKIKQANNLLNESRVFFVCIPYILFCIIPDFLFQFSLIYILISVFCFIAFPAFPHVSFLANFSCFVMKFWLLLSDLFSYSHLSFSLFFNLAFCSLISMVVAWFFFFFFCTWWRKILFFEMKRLCFIYWCIKMLLNFY